MRTFKSIEKVIKRTPIVKHIDLNDGEEPIKLTINPSEDVKEKILEIIVNNTSEENEEKLSVIDLEKKEVFIPITQMITDIKLEKEEEDSFMEYLFKDPSPEGIMLREDIIKTINKIIDDIQKDIDENIEETNNKLNNI